MSDYRIYRRGSLTGFDGATAESATFTQNRYAWTTATTSVVGQWSPSALGRQSVASIVSVAADLVSPGETVQVISDSGTVRTSVALNLDGTAWVFLFPQDSLRVTSATARVIEIAVNDLDTAELTKWFACCDSSGSGGSGDCCAYSEQSFANPGTVAVWAGRLTVFTSFAASGGLTLPALASIALGDSVMIVRIGGADVRIQTDNAADTVNGVAGLVASEYWLRNVGEAILYTRVAGGWARKQGAEAPPLQLVNPLPASPVAWSEGTQYVVISDPAGGAYNLPSLATQQIGTRLLLLNTGAGTVFVQPFAGQLIDGSVLSRNLRAGDTLMLEATSSAWMTGRGDESPDPITSALGVVLGAFRGVQYVDMTGGGVGVTLPLTTALPDLLGTVVVVLNSAATAITVSPAGAEVIDNGVTNMSVNPGARAYFISAGTGVWDSIVTQTPLAGVVTAAANTSIGNALGGGTTVEMTGAAASNLNLPAISSTISPTASIVAVFNSSGNAHTVTPFGGQTIDGVAGALAHAAGSKSLFVSDGTSNWIQILSA